MAIIHHTTLSPTKLELLTRWLPSRPWYRAGEAASEAASGEQPVLAKAGGFRLEDPSGEVGIEFMAVTDSAGGEPVTYQTPMTYRAAPLAGAEDALVGTLEHGVLGKRWVYDATRDPVAVAQLYALLTGRAEAQAQSRSDTPDRTVRVRAATDVPLQDAGTGAVHDGKRSTDVTLVLPVEGSLWLRFLRVPPAHTVPETTDSAAHITVGWTTPDGAPRHGLWCALIDSRE
ncbi:maltokinase N-terminal cap-like domain-containing protein [Streptomyces sp. AA1529]|uniref:maltokinase N-terminal cap-like domain-containing protein n=1 Tax=Streptomyces sp. AA1529 TaxID=1203257 RepID=UPI003D7613EA